jgi:hypothetical protein
MATSKIAVTEGTGKNIASYSISEDAVTKELQRVVASTSAGAEIAPALEAGNLATIAGDTTSIDGKMTACNTGAVTVAASALPTGAGTAANQTTIIGHLDGVEALLGTIDADTSTLAGAVAGTEMQVDVLTMPTTTVQATNLDIRDLSQASDAVAIYGSDDGGTTKRIIKTDSAGAIQVDLEVATVTANAGTNLNTSALALEAGGNLADIKAKTDNIPALGQALAAASVPIVLTAAQISTLTPPAAITGFALETGGNLATIAGDTTSIDGKITACNTGAVVLTTSTAEIGNVKNSGTFATQATLAAETTKVIGTVNVAAAQTIAVTNAGTFATQATLQTGSNAIGKLAANSGVDIGDVDVTSLPALAAGTNAIGKLLPPNTDVTTNAAYARKYYTNAGAVTDGIIWSPAAGTRWHVVTMYIQTSADATITLEDDKAGGDDPVWKGEVAAKSGVVLSFTEQYPMSSGEDAADLIVTTSAGNVYISCVGYEC